MLMQIPKDHLVVVAQYPLKAHSADRTSSSTTG